MFLPQHYECSLKFMFLLIGLYYAGKIVNLIKMAHLATAVTKIIQRETHKLTFSYSYFLTKLHRTKKRRFTEGQPKH